MYVHSSGPPSLADRHYHCRLLPTIQTVHENRIYSLKIYCGDTYPDLPPAVQFISRVNLPFVNQVDGKVDRAKLSVLANWNRNHSIETLLVEIRRYESSPNTWSYSNYDLRFHSGRWRLSTIASSPSPPKEVHSEWVTQLLCHATIPNVTLSRLNGSHISPAIVCSILITLFLYSLSIQFNPHYRLFIPIIR